jgi:hypothetical protein
MIIFGGIYEVVKELDDVSVLDLKHGFWHEFQEGSLVASPRHSKSKKDLFIKSNTLDSNTDTNRQSNINETTPRMSNALGQTLDLQKKVTTINLSQVRRNSVCASSSRRRRLSKPKIMKNGGMELPQKEIELQSPTSSRMKNCYLIKNGHASFENFIRNQNKNKIQLGLAQSMRNRLMSYGISEDVL